MLNFSFLFPDLLVLPLIVRLTAGFPVQIISYTQNAITFGIDHFRERVSFSQKMPSFDVSLKINNTVEADSGSYVCQVIIPGQAVFSKELKLEVRGDIHCLQCFGVN